MEQFVIVPLTARHLPQVAAIERACFSQPWPEYALAAEIGNPAGRFLVAERDGRVLGYAGMTFVAGEGYVNNVAVAEDARRSGVGAALMRELIAFSREIDLDFLSLEVRASNVPARQLYGKLGFAIAGVRHGFYSFPREDGIIMTKYFDRENGYG